MKKFTLSILLLASSLALSAQTAGQFLDVNPDARALSVANSAVATEASPFAVWNNPAASSFSEGSMSAAASYGMWQPSSADAQIISAAGFGKIGEKLSINAGVKYFMHSSFETSDQNGIYNGVFTPSEYVASAGVGYKFSGSLSAGLTVNYIGSDIGGPQSASAVSAAVGLMYLNGGFSAGLTASNIGSQLNYGGSSSYSLPMRADVGLAYRMGSEDGSHLKVSAQAGMIFADSSIMAAAGLEYGLGKTFRLAAGYNMLTAASAPSFISLGTGFSLYGVSLDLAYLLGVSGSAASNTLMLNLGYAF